jgi:hypothetical protein
MSFYGHAFPYLRFAQYDGCWLVVLLGRCTRPPDEKFTTIRGVRVLFFEWIELLLIRSFREGGFLIMCPSH